ncbi:MAG: 2-hydroxyacid dehydrogenase [Bacteriovoracia bacterium]
MQPQVLISKALPLDTHDPLWIELNKMAKIVVRPKTARKPLVEMPEVRESNLVVSMVSDIVNSRFFDRAKQLHAIVNYGVGYNNIDLSEAKRRGIVVCNTPDVLTNATAELTIGLIFAAARRFKEGTEFLRTRKYKGWSPCFLLGKEIKGSTLGIMGFGRIGQSVAQKAKALGMNVLFYSPNHKASKDFKQVSLDELLRQSDFFSIHCALNEKTNGCISHKEFSKMKQSAYIINTSRGEIIDELALIKALNKNQISGAALDVFCNEPNLKPQLRAHSKVFVLPHIGSATSQARQGMARLAVSAIVEILKGKTPTNRVDLSRWNSIQEN